MEEIAKAKKIGSHAFQIGAARVPSDNASHRQFRFLLLGCKFFGAGTWQSEPLSGYFFQ
jgi:hypothetical protein